MKLYWKSPAKLNLFLHILDRRIDGYHNLETIFQFLNYGDDMSFELRDDNKINLVTPLLGVRNEDNLVVKAAKVLQANAEHVVGPLGVDIHMVKRIPMGGGLGGGSSNAATTLMALNQLWNMQLNEEQLKTLGLQLGADVPVFVHGNSCFATGVGEQFEDCDPPEAWFLVITPKIQVNTGQIFTDPALTRNSKSIRIRAPLVWVQLAGYRNDCEAVVCKLYPDIKFVLEWLSAYGTARLTGTGASVFCAFKSEQEASKIAALIPDEYDYFVAQATNRSVGIAATEG